MSDDEPPREDGSEDDPVDDAAGLAEHPLTALRLAKHEAILAGGGYPYRFERSVLAAELHEAHSALGPASETDELVTVAGRLRSIRRMGKLTFGVLVDTSGSIQLFVDNKRLGDDEFGRFDDLDPGDWIGASGEVMTTRRGELSVRIDSFTLLAKSLRPLPDKWHGLKDVEQRSRHRYIDLIANKSSRDVAYTRSRIVSELRRQFEARGYVEVETPVLLRQATGALARPFTTHHNAFDQDMYLRIATELYLKRLIVGGIEKVYEIGRIFRNEGVDSIHNPEFTMLESYEAFADYSDIAVMVEEMFAATAVAATGSTTISYQGRELGFAPPYRRVRMVDLVADATGESISFERSSSTSCGSSLRLTVSSRGSIGATARSSRSSSTPWSQTRSGSRRSYWTTRSRCHHWPGATARTRT